MTTIPDHVGRERTVKTPEQIAAGLLVGQRLALVKAYQDDVMGDDWWIPSGLGRGLMSLGITARSIWGPYLTPLGRAVRAILKEQADDK